jgi:hypothetical protein
VPEAASQVASTADAILLNAGGSVRELLHPDVLRLIRRSQPCPLAMCCGRPCLVTDVGDTRRFVRQSETGFVARSDRVDGLSEALEDAWHQRPSWPELGRRAHTLFCQERDPDPGGTVLSLLLASSG